MLDTFFKRLEEEIVLGLFGGNNGWGCEVTSLEPLGIAIAMFERRSNRGTTKEGNLTQGGNWWL